MLLQSVGFKAMWHRVEVVIAYPTDEALGLKDKGRRSVSGVHKAKHNSSHSSSYLVFLMYIQDPCVEIVPDP